MKYILKDAVSVSPPRWSSLIKLHDINQNMFWSDLNLTKLAPISHLLRVSGSDLIWKQDSRQISEMILSLLLEVLISEKLLFLNWRVSVLFQFLFYNWDRSLRLKKWPQPQLGSSIQIFCHSALGQTWKPKI